MSVTLTELGAWLAAPESEHLEFKEARNRFDFEELVRYCVALANERGGHMVLGITDERPRKVVGSRAFQDLERTKAGLLERLHLRVEAVRIAHPDGEVTVFSVPARPIGTPIQYKGAYWMRSGDQLVPMSPDQLKAIFAESGPDYSAELCRAATISELDGNAIQRFREMWQRKAKNPALRSTPIPQLLEDAELVVDGQLTFAALILLGSHKALGRHLAQAEVIFEYRSSEGSIAYQQRKEYREGFLLYDDDLWQTANLRNEIFSYQDGLFRFEVRTFNEGAVREAILNAVAHRDYRRSGSIFVRQWPSHIEVVSPGGFPEGITAENILWRQNPRNRRLAEAFGRCGLVERSGQGADRMFESSVREGKRPPDFSRSDAHQVAVELSGEVRDPLFLRFLEQVGQETGASINTEDLIVLDAVHRDAVVPEQLRQRLGPLLDLGVLERVGRKYILSRRFYALAGKKGVYTRRRGLDRDTNKTLLLRHITLNRKAGVPYDELAQVLPGLSRNQIQSLMREMKREGLVTVEGKTKAARWFPGPAAERGARE
jgi:ATP-dependent DNA helicase RecG